MVAILAAQEEEQRRRSLQQPAILAPPSPAKSVDRVVKAPFQREGSKLSVTTLEEDEVVEGIGIRAGKKVAIGINAVRRLFRKASLFKVSALFILVAVLLGALHSS